MLEKRWKFKQWYGLDDDNTHTIEGEKYNKLIELCFSHADYFSLQLVSWTAATDKQLE
jgi:DNA-binding XRE family transcriptional regulator